MIHKKIFVLIHHSVIFIQVFNRAAGLQISINYPLLLIYFEVCTASNSSLGFERALKPQKTYSSAYALCVILSTCLPGGYE